MPYLGRNVPLPSGICPLCVFSIKLCPLYRAKLMIHWDNFPGSTVPMKALMWRAKCPIKAWRCPFAHFVSSLYNCAPSAEALCPYCVFSLQLCPIRGKTRGQFSGSVVAIRAPNQGLNASLGHKGAPLPTLCLLYITVTRNGQNKAHLGTKNIEEICPFRHRRRGMFYF